MTGRRRELFLTNALALGVLLVVLLAGWWDAAAFGLVVLAFMDVLVILRERLARYAGGEEEREEK